jgi:hypothetical protein
LIHRTTSPESFGIPLIFPTGVFPRYPNSMPPSRVKGNPNVQENFDARDKKKHR